MKTSLKEIKATIEKIPFLWIRKINCKNSHNIQSNLQIQCNFCQYPLAFFFFAEIKMHPKILTEYQRTSKILQSNSNKKYYGTVT